MRRTLVPVMLLTLLATACARPGDDEPLAWPSTGEPVLVASLRVGGGFVPYQWHLMEGPRVVVYSDGRAVADSRLVFALSSDELSDLVRALRRDLSGLGPTVDAGAQNRIADAPTTTMQVLDRAGLRSVSAYALGIHRGYPGRLVAAQDRLEALARRVLDDGTPYSSDRIRIVLDPRNESSGSAPTWPASVPLPPPASASGFEVRTADLTGSAAEEVADSLPGQTWQSGTWPVVRTADGIVYGIAWRYLTPEES